jgi:hypothetical protein
MIIQNVCFSNHNFPGMSNEYDLNGWIFVKIRGRSISGKTNQLAEEACFFWIFLRLPSKKGLEPDGVVPSGEKVIPRGGKSNDREKSPRRDRSGIDVSGFSRAACRGGKDVSVRYPGL